MAKVTIKKKPDGKRLQQIVGRVKGKDSVKVGFPKGSGEYPDGTPIVSVAVWNEFGVTDDEGNMVSPERSFFRTSMKANRKKYRNMGKKLYKKVLDGDLTKAQALELLGEEAVGDIQESIISLTSPPNAESTIARKGSSNPLVDTNVMSQSVRSEVKVGSN